MLPRRAEEFYSDDSFRLSKKVLSSERSKFCVRTTYVPMQDLRMCQMCRLNEHEQAVSRNTPSEILKEKFTSFTYFLLNWILGKVCILGLAFKLQEKNVPCVKNTFCPYLSCDSRCAYEWTRLLFPPFFLG